MKLRDLVKWMTKIDNEMMVRSRLGNEFKLEGEKKWILKDKRKLRIRGLSEKIRAHVKSECKYKNKEDLQEESRRRIFSGRGQIKNHQVLKRI